MSLFKDSGEVGHYIGAIFEDALHDPGLRAQFAKSGVLLKLRFKEPDAVMLVDFVNGEVRYEDDGRKATVEITAPADVGHRFWLGKVNIALALAKGEMRAKGPIDKIIRLVPLTKTLFPRYREKLLQSGRDDLANA
jgi:hypothetical protein